MLGAIPGYAEIDGDQLQIERIDGDPHAVLDESCASIQQFIGARSAVALLAKSGEQFLRELGLGVMSQAVV